MIVLYEKSIHPEFVLNCQIKTYLYSVCRRIWLKKLEKQKRISIQTDEFDQVISIEEDIKEHEQSNIRFKTMENALSKIGEPCKGLLEAFYINKKQMQEIAIIFNYTNADNAKTQKYKCLNRLKKLFFAEYKNL
jgi:RNA polymerase sigma factor (sigma-70 family)